ncbi:hypothetical protein BC828DRAFT_380391 [Blastocladiella britannica]|nr:hypothetical protein BC828DRAFT_380391 [Blastocladiella britannica]
MTVHSAWILPPPPMSQYPYPQQQQQQQRKRSATSAFGDLSLASLHAALDDLESGQGDPLLHRAAKRRATEAAVSRSLAGLSLHATHNVSPPPPPTPPSPSVRPGPGGSSSRVSVPVLPQRRKRSAIDLEAHPVDFPVLATVSSCSSTSSSSSSSSSSSDDDGMDDDTIRPPRAKRMRHRSPSPRSFQSSSPFALWTTARQQQQPSSSSETSTMVVTRSRPAHAARFAATAAGITLDAAVMAALRDRIAATAGADAAASVSHATLVAVARALAQGVPLPLLPPPPSTLTDVDSAPRIVELPDDYIDLDQDLDAMQVSSPDPIVSCPDEEDDEDFSAGSGFDFAHAGGMPDPIGEVPVVVMMDPGFDQSSQEQEPRIVELSDSEMDLDM